MSLKPPLFDAVPHFSQGTGVWWSGYGIYWEWPSACLTIWYFVPEDEIAKERTMPTTEPSGGERAREIITHNLKTWPVYFDAVKRGEKLFELRRDDRGFQRGDHVRLHRYDPRELHARRPNPSDYPSLTFRIGWVLTGGQFGLEPGYVAFSLAPLTGDPEPEGRS